MVKKVMIIILIFDTVSIIQSCCSSEFEYKWGRSKIDLLDNSGGDPVLTESEQINKKALGLRMTMFDSISSIAQHSRLINACYATSCGERYTRAHDLRSIHITTLNDYSIEYPAGADMTELFQARLAYIRSDYVSINTIISQINGSSHSDSSKVAFDLYLMDTTSIGGQQSFEVSLMLSDGNRLTNHTHTFTLN